MSENQIGKSETLSRYLRERDIRKSDNVIQYSAFIPSPTDLKLSVFRTSGLSEQDIWHLAVEKVQPYRGQITGRGDLVVSAITEEKLRVVSDEDPTSRHSDIVGWPDDRDFRVTIAKALAARASPAIRRQTSAV